VLLVGLSGRLVLSGTDNYDDSNENDNDNDNYNYNDNDNNAVLAKSITSAGAISRRKALILSAAAAATVTATVTATATGMETGASTIPLSQQETFRNRVATDEENIGSAANPNPNKNDDTPTMLLASSNLYRVQTTNGKTQNKQNIPFAFRPSVHKVTKERLLDDLQSKRAVFLGEHHPEGRDHRLQAALIRSLHDAIQSNNNNNNNEAANSVLPTTASGIDEEELLKATEWESRWYWSFEAYRPIFETCRELGIGLLALDIATEDRLLVETGGLEALVDLDNKLEDEYVLPDLESFSAFGSTLAYQAFVSYTLKPPYDLQQRTTLGKRTNNNISFSNFVARQMLRDGGMASVATRWLSKNPKGILVGCIGINHATFGCGVPGRVEKMLSTLSNYKPPTFQRGENGNSNNNNNKQERMVASVLINPEPLNTGTELKICQTEGRPPIDDDEDDDDSTSNKVREIFVPNTSNQVCIENSVELQNYALQIDYVPSSSDIHQRRTAMNEAAAFLQAKRGEVVLGLSDYFVFSPKETSSY
jgi:uncharacterized iron-regulated protein